MPRPHLSIVIIAYNEAAYIRGCLESVAKQTTAPDEVIVVDNNSTDDTAKIAASFRFVTVVREPVQGMIAARNRGLNEASGELIGRIDADTQIPPDWVANAHRALDTYAQVVAGVSGPAYVHDSDSKLMQIIAGLAVNQAYRKGSRLMLGHATLFGSNMVITKAAWHKVRAEACTDGQNIHEDVDLALHIGKYGQIIYDPNLKAGIAARAFHEPLGKTLHRLRIWPATVIRHRKLASKRSRTAVR